MAALVRERRHQQALSLSLPPPIPAAFGSPTYSPSISPNSPVIRSLIELEKVAVFGHGSGGIVYKVLHKSTSSVYELKVVTGMRQHAAQEAEIMKLIDSPFVVRCHWVFDAGEDSSAGDTSAVMEYMEGGSLHDLLKTRQR